jgi:branched-chain amino acid transport system permease protein
MLYRENGQFKTSYTGDQQIFPILQDRIAMALLLGLAFVAVPLLASEYLFRAILIPFVILALAALGLNILVGYCGQISLGTGAFMAVGAYAAYNFQVRIEGMPLLVSLLLGGLCATAVGVVFGIPSLRIKGLYLAVATLAAQFFVDWAFLRIKWFTNDSASGSVSVSNLVVLGLPIETPVAKYLFCLAFLALFGLLAKNLVRSHIGREWMAIRDMDVAAAVIGIRPVYAKLTAFAVSSWPVRCGASSTSARGSRRRFRSTARSSCCSWSSSVVWARSWAASSVQHLSCCCRSCSINCCRPWARWWG